MANRDAFLSQFDSSGALQWQRRGAAATTISAASTRLEQTPLCLRLVCRHRSSGHDPSSGVDNHTSNGGRDAFVIKFHTSNQAPTVATPASASPAVVIGKTTTLQVLGADDGGEASLTYAWTTVTAPTGAKLNYSANGTNAAKSTTVTFDRAGSYGVLVTITDAGGRSVTSQVSVTVSQTLTDIVLTPFTGSLRTLTLPTGTTQRFTAWAGTSSARS